MTFMLPTLDVAPAVRRPPAGPFSLAIWATGRATPSGQDAVRCKPVSRAAHVFELVSGDRPHDADRLLALRAGWPLSHIECHAFRPLRILRRRHGHGIAGPHIRGIRHQNLMGLNRSATAPPSEVRPAIGLRRPCNLTTCATMASDYLERQPRISERWVTRCYLGRRASTSADSGTSP